MKKLFHISFPQVFGLAAVHRLVFENPGETEAMALAGFEGTKEADIDAKMAEGQKGLDGSFDNGKKEIDRKADEYKKKYEGKEDADKAKAAIEAARVSAQAKLDAKYKASTETLKRNAQTSSNEMANTLVADRKAKAGYKFRDSHLESVSIGNSSLDWKPEGKNFTNEDMSDGAYKEILIGMLRAVYIAEGEEAANKLSEKMKKEKPDFEKMKYDSDYNFAQGVEHKPPLIQFDPDVTSGDYNSRKLAGKIFGFNHAADNLIKDEAAREAYKAYLAEAGRKAGKAEDAKQVEEILSPDEWVKANPQHVDKAAEVDEAKLDQERLSRVNDVVKFIPDAKTWEREQLKGLLLARLKSEPDPKKWDAIIADTGKKCLGVDDVANISILEITKIKINGINDLVGGKTGEMGQYVLDTGKNHDGKTRGYVAGLLMEAEERFKDQPQLLKQYKENLRRVTDSEDFKKKLGQSLEDSDYYSKRQRDQVWGKGADDQNREENRKLGAANDALFDVARAELPTPGKFGAEAKDKADEKAKNFPREKFVDDMLADVPDTKGTERSMLRGMLMAALGTGKNPDGTVKTPEQMAAAVKPILDAMGLKKENMKDVTEADHLKKVLEGRNDFGEYGKKLDGASKGYYAGLLYQAEQKYKDDPKFLAAYKKHLQDSLNSDGFKSATEEKLAKIKKYQDYLEDPVLSKRLTEEDKRTYQDGIAKLSDEIFMESRKATKWPEDFDKDFDRTRKEEVQKVNREFLDKYGTQDKLDPKGSKTSLGAIFDSIDKVKISDENRDIIKKKREDLQKELDKAKTPEARLAILARAMDYSTSLNDSESRYQDVASKYTATAKILDASTDKKKSDKYVRDMAKFLGLKEDDPKVQDALTKVKDAKDEDRAAVLADQVAALTAAAPDKARPYTKEDYDVYSKYIAEKREASKDKKKPAPGAGGGTGGGTPGGTPSGGGGAPKTGPGGGAPKPKPAPGGTPEAKEDAPKSPAEQAKGALVGVLASYIGKMKQFAELGITSPEILAQKVSAEIGSRVAGIDLSKAKNQVISVAGGGAQLTINGGKVTLINVAPWAQKIFAKAKEEAAAPAGPDSTSPDKPKEEIEKQRDELVGKILAYSNANYISWIESSKDGTAVASKFMTELSAFVSRSGLNLSILDQSRFVNQYGFVQPNQQPKNVTVSVSKSGIGVRVFDAKTT